MARKRGKGAHTECEQRERERERVCINAHSRASKPSAGLKRSLQENQAKATGRAGRAHGNGVSSCPPSRRPFLPPGRRVYSKPRRNPPR